MPTSPELVDRGAATTWEPPVLDGRSAAVQSRPAAPEVGRPFEVSATAGIPETLLAPARAAASNAGYVAGWNHGHREGAAQAADEVARAQAAADARLAAKLAELDDAVRALHAAADSLTNREAAGAAEVEQLIVDGAFSVAESLVGLTLGDDEQRGRVAVARALAFAPPTGPVTIAVSERDAATVRATVELPAEVRVTVDPSLAPGDSYARFGASTADARISAGLDRVRALFTPSIVREAS